MTLSSLQVAANAHDFIRLVNVELHGNRVLPVQNAKA
jgi:hypothetical protein